MSDQNKLRLEGVTLLVRDPLPFYLTHLYIAKTIEQKIQYNIILNLNCTSERNILSKFHLSNIYCLGVGSF